MARSINIMGLVGTGVMGAGIAQIAAQQYRKDKLGISQS